jgi:hypothetical protein
MDEVVGLGHGTSSVVRLIFLFLDAQSGYPHDP